MKVHVYYDNVTGIIGGWTAATAWIQPRETETTGVALLDVEDPHALELDVATIDEVRDGRAANAARERRAAAERLSLARQLAALEARVVNANAAAARRAGGLVKAALQAEADAARAEAKELEARLSAAE